jgi:anti-sigma factor RsiW
MVEREHIELERLQAYLDQELDADEMQFVMRHLAACSQCEAEVDRLRALFLVIESLPDIDLARNLVPSVLGSIRSWKTTTLSLRVFPLLQAGTTAILLGLLWPMIRDDFLRLSATIRAWSILAWVEYQADLIHASAVEFINRANGRIGDFLAGVKPVAPGWSASAWWLILVGGFVVWLIGNGILLRNAERRSNRS